MDLTGTLHRLWSSGGRCLPRVVPWAYSLPGCDLPALWELLLHLSQPGVVHETETVPPLAVDTVYSGLLAAHEHCRDVSALRADGKAALLAKDSTRAAPEREASICCDSITVGGICGGSRTRSAGTGDSQESRERRECAIGIDVSQSDTHADHAGDFTQAEAGGNSGKTVKSARPLARCDDCHRLCHECCCLLVLLPRARNIALSRCSLAYENFQKRFR